MAFTCKHKHLIVEKYFSDFKFLPQPPFRGLRLVLLFWDGTAWVQEWLPLLGVLLCGCSVMTLWIWFVWCQPHHFMPQIGAEWFLYSLGFMVRKDATFEVCAVFVLIKSLCNSWYWTYFRCSACCFTPTQLHLNPRVCSKITVKVITLKSCSKWCMHSLMITQNTFAASDTFKLNCFSTMVLHVRLCNPTLLIIWWEKITSTLSLQR